MIEGVFEYLEDKGLTKRNGVFIEDEKIKYIRTFVRDVALYKIDGVLYFGKPFDNEFSIQGITASKMYNDLGITNPPVSLMRLTSGKNIKKLITLSQDVQSIPMYYATLASKILRPLIGNNSKRIAQDKWSDLLSNNEIRDKLLSVMTRECLSQIIDLYLLGELRSDIDTYMDQYFLIKLPNEDKYSQAIPIDLDNAELMHCPPTNQDKFSQFLNRTYASYTLIEQEDYASYEERIETLRDLLFEGKLPSRNIKTLRKGVNYNLPEEIKKTCKKNNLDAFINTTYTPYAMAWDYLQEGLARDLEE